MAGLATSGTLATAATALAEGRDDREILSSAVYVEQVATFSYGRIAASGVLGPDTLVARLFSAQDQEHAATLTRALGALGGTAAPKPQEPSQVPGLSRAIHGGRRSATMFAVTLEQSAVTAYYAAQATIEDPRLLVTVASIMACQAQHLVVLRQSQGRDPAPDPFVTGKRR